MTAIMIKGQTYDLSPDEPAQAALYNAAYELLYTQTRILELTQQLRQHLDRTDATVRQNYRYPDTLNYSPGPHEIVVLIGQVAPLMDAVEALLKISGVKPIDETA